MLLKTGMNKWILALIGYFLYRFPGALLGFFLGSALEKITINYDNHNNFFTKVTPDDLEIKLLTLAAVIIKSDGKVERNELSYVRNYFISQYGKENSDKIFKLFNTQIKKQTQSIPEIAKSFVNKTDYATRLQVLHFLYGVANADGHISRLELYKINEIARELRIKNVDVESIKAMFIKSTDSSYKILEVSPKASNDEIKKSYRLMVKKYHPDKIKTKDSALLKGAAEKFRQVQEAYELLKKERGL